MADIGVDRVGEVERRRARRQVLHLALRREDEHLVLEQIDLELREKLGGILLRVGLDELAQPCHLLPTGVAVPLCPAALLVEDVGGDPVLGELVHVHGADLDLERTPLGSDHRRVKRLVQV